MRKVYYVLLILHVCIIPAFPENSQSSIYADQSDTIKELSVSDNQKSDHNLKPSVQSPTSDQCLPISIGLSLQGVGIRETPIEGRRDWDPSISASLNVFYSKDNFRIGVRDLTCLSTNTTLLFGKIIAISASPCAAVQFDAHLPIATSKYGVEFAGNFQIQYEQKYSLITDEYEYSGISFVPSLLTYFNILLVNDVKKAGALFEFYCRMNYITHRIAITGNIFGAVLPEKALWLQIGFNIEMRFKKREHI